MPPSDHAPGSSTSLRSANQQRVLAVLRRASMRGAEQTTPTSQAELARITSLAPATVSTIVRDLARAGLVDVEPGAGRRGTAVRLARAAGLVAGCDFGHSHVAVAIADLTGRVIAETRQRLDADHTHVQGLDLAAAMVDGLFDQSHADRADLRAVGLGLPAPINDGVVQSSAILPGWVGVQAPDAASERFGCATQVLNDANLGALAEQRVGAGRGHSCVAFVKVSSGVGAGIVIHGRPFQGEGGTAGEIGHLTFDDEGPLCRCGGRGCLEAYASIGAITRMLVDQFPDAGVEEVVAAAHQGQVGVVRALEDAGLRLGWGLASLVNLLNPGVVIVGGDLAQVGDLLLEPARIGLRRHALDTVANTPVVASELGSRASLVGTLLVAAESIELEIDD